MALDLEAPPNQSSPEFIGSFPSECGQDYLLRHPAVDKHEAERAQHKDSGFPRAGTCDDHKRYGGIVEYARLLLRIWSVRVKARHGGTDKCDEFVEWDHFASSAFAHAKVLW
jgi:hypothetical protein